MVLCLVDRLIILIRVDIALVLIARTVHLSVLLWRHNARLLHIERRDTVVLHLCSQFLGIAIIGVVHRAQVISPQISCRTITTAVTITTLET